MGRINNSLKELSYGNINIRIQMDEVIKNNKDLINRIIVLADIC